MTPLNRRGSSRLPSTGLADSQYVLQGDASHPAVRVWPGFLSERSILVDEKVIVCQCSARESPKPGQRFL